MKKFAGRVVAYCCALALMMAAMCPIFAEATEYGWKNTRESAVEYLDEDFYAKPGFQSTLPVLVLGRDEKVDFYLENGTLDQGSDYQAAYHPEPDDTDDSEEDREKADYRLSFSANTHTALGENFWQEPVTNEWYLLGNMHDKSLLRNYLALSLAGEMHEDVSKVQHCEVFLEDAGGLRYQGVYLMVAPAETKRVSLHRGSTKQQGSTALDTYAERDGFLEEGLFITSDTSQSVEADVARQIEQGIDTAERSIYAADYNDFSRYVNYIDTEKLYDYFLLYELFGNYGDVYIASYAYDLDSNLLWPKVTADFEDALDNAQLDPMDSLDVRLMDAPYYMALVKNTNFINGLIERYKLLCQTVMKSSELEERVDRAVEQLGSAQKRDWFRWEAAYNGVDMYWLDPVGISDADTAATRDEPPDRNTYSYEQEINKLKYILREHGQYLFLGMSTLYDQDNMIGDDAPYVRNTWMFLVFLIIFVVSIRIVRHRTR